MMAIVRCGVPPLRGLEGRDAVGDRFGAGHRRRAVRERTQDDQQAQCLDARHRRRDARDVRWRPRQHLHHPHADEEQRSDHERIGRDREDRAALADATQVDGHDEQDREDDELDLDLAKHRKCRREREHPGRDAHRDREDVVDEQRRCADQARQHAEVRPRHDVTAAAAGIRLDGLPVRERDQAEERHDQHRDGHHEPERRRTRDEQGEHRGLGRVGDRRHDVAREDRKRLPDREALGQLGLAGQRPAEDEGANGGHRQPDPRRRSLGARPRLEDARRGVAEVATVWRLDRNSPVAGSAPLLRFGRFAPGSSE